MINFTKVETAGTKTALPEGWYTVHVAKSELRESKNGPNTLINAEFNILSPEKYNKRKIWNNFNLGTASLWALKTFLDSSGSDLLNKGDVTEQVIADSMVGLTCQAYLEPDSAPNGDPRNKITSWKSMDTPVQSGASTTAEVPKSPLFK